MNSRVRSAFNRVLRLVALSLALGVGTPLWAAVTEINATGGTSSSNGLHFYIEDTTHMQVKRLNNTGQLYDNSRIPPHARLDNGVFLRANGTLYGPSFALTSVSLSPTMYTTYNISAASPAGAATAGVPQSALATFGIAGGPQVRITWKYTLPYDFITADVTVTIPAAYSVSAANPVRYYHVIDTYLGGSDYGCGVTFVDGNGKRVVGTYPPASGSTCPTSSSIPSNVSIVESFRERSGLSFSHYCTSLWSNFWGSASSSTACAISRSVPLADTVTTTYQDTGVAIEYDFTAAGTYTFSYDFVIGSPVVPPYDHLEIQHDGSATLCPETVTVLACSVSTVPCPPESYVGQGTLTGSLTVTPASPAVGVTPAVFTLGSGAPSTTVSLQGTAPGGTYTLGSSGLSTIPLNGTKCWNAATNSASCSFTVTNVPCVAGYECLESGLTYNNLTTTPAARNPLYTKLSGTDFVFDVVALQSGGQAAAAYTANSGVTVELFDDSATPQPACSAYANPVAAQAITFAAGNAGRKTLATNFNLPNAYRKLRCRVKDTNITPTVYGCSSDAFTVRPPAFASIASSNANADTSGVSATNTPTVKTGAAFTLVANSGVPGYDNVPKVNSALLEWPGAPSAGRAAPGTGTIDGIVPGSLVFTTAATAASGNGASGAFTYDEAGYFRFKAYGVYDDGFSGYSGDVANGDCVSGSATAADNFSNSASGGKYGCNVGNLAPSVYFGRFIPDHFDTGVSQACVVGDFTYSAQPFPLSVTARNLSGGATQNYAGGFAKTVTLSARAADDSAANPGPGALASASVAAASFSAGVASVGPSYAFSAVQTAQTAVRIRAIDSESVSSLRSPAALSSEGQAKVRSGRARLASAYGSELLDLPVLFRTEYWNGSGWVLNTDDSCTGDTTLSSGAANAVSLTLASTPATLPTCVFDSGSPGRSGTGCVAAAASARRFKEGATPTVGFAGDFNLWLQAPGSGNFGSTRVTATVPAWLGPVAPVQATFGRYKTPLILRRENY